MFPDFYPVWEMVGEKSGREGPGQNACSTDRHRQIASGNRGSKEEVAEGGQSAAMSTH